METGPTLALLIKVFDFSLLNAWMISCSLATILVEVWMIMHISERLLSARSRIKAGTVDLERSLSLDIGTSYVQHNCQQSGSAPAPLILKYKTANIIFTSVEVDSLEQARRLPRDSVHTASPM